MRGPQPIGGDPATVRQLARTLAGQGDWLASLAGILRGLADPAVARWDSPAGEAFGRRGADVAGVVDRVSRRYAVAARALLGLAEALARTQAAVGQAQRAHDEAWPEFLAAGDAVALAEASDDPSVRSTAPRLRARMVEAGERVELVQRQADEAHEQYRLADRECAKVLCGLLSDGLTDGGWYDAVTATRDVARSVGGVAGLAASVPFPPLQTVAAPVAAVADGVGLATDATVLAVWGDGSWSSVALGATAAAVGPVAGVLKNGARATNAAAQAAAATRVERRGLRLGVRHRLAAGIGAPGARSYGKAPTPATRTVPWTLPSRHPRAWGRWAVDQAEVRTRAAVQNRWLDDWRVITGTPGTSTSMLVSAWGVEAGGSVLGTVDSARGRRAAQEQDRAAAQAGHRAQLREQPTPDR
ncbi:hypothetical protein GCM10027517_28550 [Phycicoccus ginsengisoli]